MATIYAIVNFVTGKAYVGCTRGKPQKRFREHRCLLNNGKHNEADLQADWRKYGPGSFELQLLSWSVGESLDQMRSAEIIWMDYYAAKGLLYNTRRISFQLTPEAIAKGVANAHKEPGKRWTPEANEKRRLAQLGKPKGHGAKISATKRAKKLMQADEIV